MAAAELQNPHAAVEEKTRELNEKVARQVSDILEQADRRGSPGKPILAYTVPTPGVRYYF